jgi:hypothetical protein
VKEAILILSDGKIDEIKGLANKAKRGRLGRSMVIEDAEKKVKVMRFVTNLRPRLRQRFSTDFQKAFNLLVKYDGPCREQTIKSILRLSGNDVNKLRMFCGPGAPDFREIIEAADKHRGEDT